MPKTCFNNNTYEVPKTQKTAETPESTLLRQWTLDIEPLNDCVGSLACTFNHIHLWNMAQQYHIFSRKSCLYHRWYYMCTLIITLISYVPKVASRKVVDLLVIVPYSSTVISSLYFPYITYCTTFVSMRVIAQYPISEICTTGLCSAWPSTVALLVM